jgi:hypothetical protein
MAFATAAAPLRTALSRSAYSLCAVPRLSRAATAAAAAAAAPHPARMSSSSSPPSEAAAAKRADELRGPEGSTYPA